jgi:molecular chaperone DnaJ
MTSKRDYYEVLGVAKDVGPDELRKAYKKLALKHHPDRNQGDAEAEAKFKEATEAFGILSDEDKRARYDRFGHAGVEGGFNAGSGDIFSHFQDIFSEFFGGSGMGGFGFGGQQRQGQQRRGQDARTQVRLTLKEAVIGCKKEVAVRAPAACDDCHGSGAAKGSSRIACVMCGGAGQVTSARGFVMFTQACPRCEGQGTIVEKPCKKCGGGGYVEKSKKVVVNFPPGIDSGQRLRVSGQGMAGPAKSPPGDLYVDIEVEQDNRFEREQNDLITHLPISFAQAAVGTSLTLELIDGSKLNVDIPAGTQPGDVISFRNKGVPSVDGRGGKGTLHVVARVTVPKELSPKAKELLDQLDRELGTTSNAPFARRANYG